MRKYLLPTLFILAMPILSQAACFTALTIETDDEIYPGRGEVQICRNDEDRLEKIRIIKPVANPYQADDTADQYDERNPIVSITMGQLNRTESEISIMRPKRLGVEITAATISLVGGKTINTKEGGTVLLKVVKSKILGKYHKLILGLFKKDGEWITYIKRPHEKSWREVRSLFFSSGIDGIKKIEIN